MKPFEKKKRFGKKSFSKEGSNDRSAKRSFSRPAERGFAGGSRGERPEIFKTTCGSCGREAIVPFKPLGNKPILCKACFVKKPSFAPHTEQPARNARTAPAASPSSDQLDMINRKLDKIMRALEID